MVSTDTTSVRKQNKRIWFLTDQDAEVLYLDLSIYPAYNRVKEPSGGKKDDLNKRKICDKGHDRSG